VNDTLVRAIRTESAEALKWWFGVSAGVVWKWRKAFGVSGTATTLGSKRAHQHHSEAGAKVMKRRKWTEEELAEKRRVSSELGLKPGVRWTPERGGWTPEQLALLGTDTDTAIAGRLNRTLNAVRLKRERLAIPKHVPSTQG
jgi:hypothetical protein